MPAISDVIQGAIKVTNLPQEICVQSVQDLIQLLPGFLAVEVPSSITNVVISAQQPSEDQRDSLWIRLNNSGGFIGFYIYANGQWRQVYPIPNEIFWLYGDSREPPSGFTVAFDASSPISNTSLKTWLKGLSHWHDDVVNTWFDYFPVVFSGF